MIIDDEDFKLTSSVANTSGFLSSEVKNIIIKGDIPNFVNFGDISRIEVKASIPLEKTETSLNEIEILEEPELEIVGSSNKTESQVSENVIFYFDANNISTVDALPKIIRVDSTLENYIVAESKIPSNTKFQSRETGNSDLFVYHIAGTPDDEYTTIEPSDRSLVDKIAFLYKDFIKNTSEIGSYSIVINDNASDFIETKFSIIYSKNNIDEKINISNNIIVKLPEIPANFKNYGSGFIGVKGVIRIGENLNIRADVARCNIDSSIREEYPITIKAIVSGDEDITISLLETSNNSGIFEFENIPTILNPENPVVQNNSVLEVTRKDDLIITMSCNNIDLSSEILVDPLGIVFNSLTNEPISNAKVELVGIDSMGNEFIPEVFDLDLNPISNIQFTDNNGLYWFPFIASGDYRLRVIDLEGYNTPSKLPIDKIASGREIDVNGSYEGVFNVPQNSPIITIDIPVDPILNNNLLIKKESDRSSVEIGEIINYTVSLTNLSNRDIVDVNVIDKLPFGFELVDVDGLDYTKNKNQFTINIPLFLSGDELDINYKVLVKMNAVNSDGVNTVQAFGELYESNIAKSKVEIIKDNIFYNPLIMGKVYKDCNVNNQKDERELGIPGVKVYLDNGYYAITDKNGNYKIYNLRAKTYSVRIDKSTIPKPYTFNDVSNRNARDPYSVFADLKFGELNRTDFRDIDCSDKSMEKLKNRKENLLDIRTEIERSSERELNFNDAIKNDLKSELDEGLIGEQAENIGVIYSNEYDYKEKSLDIYKSEFIDDYIDDGNLVDETYIDDIYIDSDAQNKAIESIKEKENYKSVETTINLEEKALDIKYDNNLGFVDIENDDILKQNKVSIRIKGSSKGKIQLVVNNNPIFEEKIGQSVVFRDKDLVMVEYVSIQLGEGVNILDVRQLDDFGNIRKEEAIKVVASGKFSKINVVLPKDNKIVANSSKPIDVRVSLVDRNNIPISGKYSITLQNNIGYWDVEDLNDEDKGVQTIVDDGEAIFKLIPPDSADSGELLFSVNDIIKREKIFAISYLRDLFAVGIVEGVINFKNTELAENIVTTGLEEEFSNFDVDNKQNGRISLFLKGKVKGDFLLTLAYDSDKKERDKLYQDIEPEEFYPIYGDSSINGFEAQSTSKLFVKIEKNNSFILYGDLNTRDYSNNNISLGNYNRTLTGIKHSVETSEYKASYYIAQENFNARVKEIRGEGSFGPYFFTDGEEVVSNSEKVSLVTRDRNTGTIIDETPLTRFRDYEVNGFYDGLIFREAIPSIDKDFNEVYIRIEYEVASDNEDYLVYGFSGEYNINNNFSAGANYNKSEQEDEEYNVKSLNLNYDNGGFKANIELAESDNGDKGQAAKLYAKYNKDGNLLEIRSQLADDKFFNKYSSVRNINQETTIRSRNNISNGLNIKNSLFLTKDNQLKKKNQSIKTTVEKNIDDNLKIESGVRYTKTEISDFNQDSTMGSARLTWKPSFYDAINTYYEYEQDFDISEINRQEFGVEHALSSKGNIYLKHETLSNLSNEFELSNENTKNKRTVLGADYGLSENTNLYSEYKIDEAVSLKDAEAVVGARNKFDINDEWKGNIAIERIENIEGERGSSTSFSTAFQRTIEKDYKTIYRLQYRDTNVGDYYIGSLGYIRKLNDNFSLLLKNTSSYEGFDSSIKNRFFSGFSYRDNKENKLNLLFKYENEFEKEKDYVITNELGFQANYKINQNHQISGMYSIKNIKNQVDNFNYTANWLSSRYSYYINDSFDIGLSGSYLFDNETSKNYVLGAEIGYLMDDNIWISLGYNFEGLEDNKFSSETFNTEGFYVRFRFKLNEEHFRWLQ
jgi:uncharacterized repeat protein (TIGR01451 family)